MKDTVYLTKMHQPQAGYHGTHEAIPPSQSSRESMVQDKQFFCSA